jgi:endoglucanase
MLLDNVFIYATTDHGYARVHSLDGMPLMTAGGCGGKVKNGYLFDLKGDTGCRIGYTGLRLMDNAQFGPAKLPSDWVALKSGQPQPATGFPAEFSYNAIRIPLYLAWAGFDQPRYHAGFLQMWGKRGPRGFPLVDLAKGQASKWVEEASYEGIPALSACAMKGVSFPTQLRSPQALDHYYPATLQLLTLIAARMRYPSCLKD